MNGCSLTFAILHFQLSGHSAKYPQNVDARMTTALRNSVRLVVGIS
jgi:hypothetical protein